MVNRHAALAIPDHDGLALIGDADRGDVACRCTRRSERLFHAAQLRRPNLHRVMFDPACLRKDLRELVLRGTAHFTWRAE